jgi:SAM-dependent methyltransferase
MKQYGKAYRVFSYKGEIYMGSDSHNQRSVDYIFSRFDSNAFKNCSVLDLGCAGGGLLFYLLEKGAAKVVGVERDVERAQVAIDIKNRFNLSNFTIVIDEIQNYLENTIERFDLILLLNILHHSPNPIQIIDQICEIGPNQVILELPTRRIYTPYSKDKEIKRKFLFPISSNRIIEEFVKRDYFLEDVFDSDNSARFPGGNRRIYVLKKHKIKVISLGEVGRFDDCLVIGPGTSGKTTLMRKLTNYPLEKSLSKHKPRVNFFKAKSSNLPHYAYLPPNWKSPKLSPRFLSFKWNLRAWVIFALREKREVVICRATKHNRVERLELRMHQLYLKKLEKKEIDEILCFLKSSKGSLNLQRHIIASIGLVRFFLLRRIIRQEFIANYNFSYQKLFFMLRKRDLKFVVYETNH